ncbi:MAG: AAA family ATPase [Bryobacteraceae bacterium]|nr:AAA family ATPase [Bryobacteraceae bacterium]
MVRRIKVSNYKSLRSLEVDLRPLSVLFGPNAAGKSNFIDALQLLSRIASSRTLKEAFEPPYRGKPIESFSFDESGIEGLMRRDSVSFTLEVDIELSPQVIAAVNRDILETKRGQAAAAPVDASKAFIHHKDIRYRLEIEVTPRTGALHVCDEYVAPLGRDGKPKSRPTPFVERQGDRIHLRMEGQSHPTYFERYLDHAIISRPHYAPHYPHLSALQREFRSWFFYYFEPRERMRAATAVKEVRHIGLMGEELASFLNTLRNLDAPQFEAVEKALHSLIPTISGINTSVNKLGEVELCLMEATTPMPARVLSEGTLRVLGLLALGGVKEPPAVIGFEEPENGVHPRRIRDIAKILTGRAASGATQLIVTTHSPILPDHIPDADLYVCRKVNGSTMIESFSSWGPLYREAVISSGLDDSQERLPVSERMLRGDFDA